MRDSRRKILATMWEATNLYHDWLRPFSYALTILPVGVQQNVQIRSHFTSTLIEAELSSYVVTLFVCK